LLLSNGIPSCAGAIVLLENANKTAIVITYGTENETSFGTPILVKILVDDKDVNNAKQTEIKLIHSIFHPPATIIANAKNPSPAVFPENCPALNRNNPPANPAIADDSSTPIH
jgi:hypothetical protein